MYIARRISTQEWINDFQEGATPEALANNAVNAGISIGDIEIVTVTPEEFETIKESVIAPIRIIAQQQEDLTRQQLLTVLNEARTAWGFTKPQMKALVQAIKQIAAGDLDNL